VVDAPSQVTWHARPLSVKAVGAASLRCQLPYMPKETLPPGAMVAVHAALTAVTAAPFCWTLAYGSREGGSLEEVTAHRDRPASDLELAGRAVIDEESDDDGGDPRDKDGQQ
jgi:hypothetical protein